jgi:general stress protein YciG
LLSSEKFTLNKTKRTTKKASKSTGGKRGFASMSKSRRIEVARKGGRAAAKARARAR